MTHSQWSVFAQNLGKRGQTLDSLQYLTSLVVNKYTEDYIRVKLDIENYRERRKNSTRNIRNSNKLSLRILFLLTSLKEDKKNCKI